MSAPMTGSAASSQAPEVVIAIHGQDVAGWRAHDLDTLVRRNVGTLGGLAADLGAAYGEDLGAADVYRSSVKEGGHHGIYSDGSCVHAFRCVLGEGRLVGGVGGTPLWFASAVPTPLLLRGRLGTSIGTELSGCGGAMSQPAEDLLRWLDPFFRGDGRASARAQSRTVRSPTSHRLSTFVPRRWAIRRSSVPM